jgi:hypothetical protein
MAESSMTALRRRLAVIFDDDASHTSKGAAARRIFNAALAGLIVVNVATIVLESVESIDVKYLDVFVEIERVATAIFTGAGNGRRKNAWRRHLDHWHWYARFVLGSHTGQFPGSTEVAPRARRSSSSLSGCVIEHLSALRAPLACDRAHS